MIAGKSFVAVLWAFTVMLLAWPARAAQTDETQKVAEFLRDNVINRMVRMESEGTIAGGTVAYTFRRESVFCNLVEANDAFTFDVIVWIQQKNWDLKDGHRVEPPRAEDRAEVTRYTISRRESTRRPVGHRETLTTTQPRWRGDSEAVRIELADNRLILESYTGLYSDYFAPGGGFYPGACHERQELWLEDGKLHSTTVTKVFKVDPETLERTPVEKDESPLTEVEIKRFPIH